jgi:hypothetical protein
MGIAICLISCTINIFQRIWVIDKFIMMQEHKNKNKNSMASYFNKDIKELF